MNLTSVLKGVLSFGLALTSVLGTSAPIYAQDTKSAENAEAISFPNVQSYVTSDEGTYKQQDSTRIYVVNDAQQKDNQVLVNDLLLMSSALKDKQIVSSAPKIVFGSESNASANDMVIKLKDVPELADKNQSYKITISDRVEVEAKDEVGIYYGMITLIQALQINDKELPKGVILDYPDTNDRSLHLDAARKFFTKDWIIALIKDLSWQKYNSLQFHFSENEGFRLESDTLNSINFQYDGDNYLTKQDMLDIIKVANDYHIEIIPSLDSPGHLGKVLQYLDPSYNCSALFPNDQRRTQCFNIFTNPEAKQFLVNLMSEFITFFSEAGCKHFNIGGDEFLANFANFSNEQYVQIINYFNEISQICKDHGMTPRAWNDGLLFGDYTGYKLDPAIEICYWAAPENTATIQEFIENGNRVMNYSDVYMYYVLSSWWQSNACPEGDRIYDEWHTGKFSTTRDGAQTLTKPYADSVVGSSYAIWCDSPNYMTQDQIAQNIYYRTRATAFKQWNYQEPNKQSYEQFQTAWNAVGRAPGYSSALPEPGAITTDLDSATVVRRFVDIDTNEEIAQPYTMYGRIGYDYTVTPDELLGYEYIEADAPLTGTLDANKVVTFKYRLHTDKTALKEALDSKLMEDRYIPETFANYKAALEHAQLVYDNPRSVQSAVSEAVEQLALTSQEVVLMEYYALYAEVKYPLQNFGYGAAYDTYLSAVNAAQQAVEAQNASLDEIANLTNAIIAARNNLKPSTNRTPSVVTRMQPYQHYGYSRMIDGNTGTYCWFASGQGLNDTIDFVFPSLMNMSSIHIQEPSGEDIITNANVLISEDGETFTKVGTIAKPDIDVTIDFEPQNVRKVRIQFAEESKFWFKISEITFVGEPVTQDPSLRQTLNEYATVDLTTKSLETASVFVNAYLEAQRVHASGLLDIASVQDQLVKAYKELAQKSNGYVDLVAYSISLEGNTCVNFYFRVNDAMKNDPSAYLQFVKENGQVEKHLVKDLKPSEKNGLYRVQIPMVAREMNDMITASLFYTAKDGNLDIILYDDCSVVTYAQAILEDQESYSPESVAAVKAMLNFGASSQRYFHYKEDALANAILPVDEQVVSVEPSVYAPYAPSKSGHVSGLTYLGASTLLKDDMSVSHYVHVDGNVDDYTFKIDGNIVKPVQKGKDYYVEVANIYAKDLGTSHVFEVTKANETLQVSYSVLGYAYSAMQDEKTPQALKDVVNSMYVYHQAALAYAQSVTK